MISTIPKHRIIVGPDPGMVINRPYYDEVIKTMGGCRTHAISLNDFPPSAQIFDQYHWHPIHEQGKWQYSSFYWFTHLMRQLLNTGDQIYVHCASGINRSRCFTFAYLVGSRLETVMDVDKYLQGTSSIFERNIRNGYIPPKILDFIQTVGMNPQHSLNFLLT